MATPEMTTVCIPDSLLAEVEKAAREQARTVNEVFADAVVFYLKDQQWKGLKSYGRERALLLGLGEGDVERLIAESRKEYGG